MAQDFTPSTACAYASYKREPELSRPGESRTKRLKFVKMPCRFSWEEEEPMHLEKVTQKQLASKKLGKLVGGFFSGFNP